MQLYDSLTKSMKAFPEKEEGPVLIYACGPTVYHYAHIGNLRTFLTADLLRRYLEYKGRAVKLVMNITDVGHMLNDAEDGEDKIEAAAKREGKTQEEIARFYEGAFFRDLRALNFKVEATAFPRATANVEGEKGMIELVTTLLDKGLAYPTDKGDVYYDVGKFGNYGRLSGNTVESLKAGARVEVKEDKKHPADFALWIHNEAHQMQWEFAWNGRRFRGYPGWHLECSAMAQKYLGTTIDLHVGGEDLKFPHHECEIAQSEGASGQPFSRHWLHVTYLVVDGEKMSKSKGNFYTLQDLLDKGYSAAAVRWLLLSAHYRTQLNFTLEGLSSAQKIVDYLRTTAMRLRDIALSDFQDPDTTEAAQWIGVCDQTPVSISQDLEKDLNISAAMADLREFLRSANKCLQEGVIGKDGAARGVKSLEEVDKIFGVGLFALENEEPDDVKELALKRRIARQNKDWAASDRLRDEIDAKGWIVEDTPQGQKLRKA